MDYYNDAMAMLLDYIEGVSIEEDNVYGEVLDAAFNLSYTLGCWGINSDYAFYQAARRVTGDL